MKQHTVPSIGSVVAPLSAFTYVPSEGHGEDKTEAKIKIDGVDFDVSSRSRTSLLGVIGQAHSVFNLFTPQEVFERAQAHNPARKVRPRLRRTASSPWPSPTARRSCSTSTPFAPR